MICAFSSAPRIAEVVAVDVGKSNWHVMLLLAIQRTSNRWWLVHAHRWLAW
jgi:hypothetical protein